MNRHITHLYDEHYRLLGAQSFCATELDYSILDRHVSFLNQLDAISTGAIAVFDLFKKEHAYLSPKFESLFGWDMERAKEQGNKYIDEKVHPDDLQLMLEAGLYLLRFAFTISPEKRKDFKLLTDYRTKNAAGEYVRVVEQHSILENDKSGNIWLSLAIMDRSPYSDVRTPLRSRLMNFKTGEVFLFPPEKKERLGGTLTTREKEVLQLIAQGLISKEIADKLYLSVNTVNTHRQRIIEKLNVANTFEAIKYATDIGLLTNI